MNSSNCYSSLHPFPFDLNEDDQHQHHQLFSLQSQPSSSLNCPDYFNSTASDPAAYYQREPQQFQDQEDQDGPLESTESGLKLSKWKKEERVNESHHQGLADNSTSAKWMSSKMRMMKKMMSSDHSTDLSNNFTPKIKDQKKQLPSSPDNSSRSSYNNINNSSSSTTIRVCADCNTTKTPLWRSGPRGPMSLCNACGIRQRKARRAMAEAAAAANGSIVAAETSKPSMKSNKVQNKAKRSSSNGFKNNNNNNKKCKNAAGPLQAQGGRKNKLCFEDLKIILSNNSAFHRSVFPQDEKEAAILLMALSYGLVHG